MTPTAGSVGVALRAGLDAEDLRRRGVLTCIGIDPGLDGAVAWMAPGTPPILRVADTPTVRTVARRRFEVAAMRALLCSFGRVALVVLEEPGVRPGEGVVGAFSFGRGLGIWEGLVVGLGLPYLMVAPSKWKRLMGATADKEATRLLVQQRYPGAADQLARKRDHGRAEAVLLAAYGQRQLGTRDGV